LGISGEFKPVRDTNWLELIRKSIVSRGIMLVRIGYFFIIVSLIMIIIFVTSYQAGMPLYNLFLIGLLLIMLGNFILIRFRKSHEKTERFHLIRKMRSRDKNEGD
jgi:hypothetical protein